ncbi:transposase [Salmonella enterica subsp. enterica serovar Typhimurium]|nr:transposase [Salmonella enterica subsp. enterica serovar Typhimurium]
MLRNNLSARTIRRRLQQWGLVARRPLLRLPLTLHHRRMRLQWCVERRTWTTEWHDIIFSDESRFCLQHHDGRIRVWRQRGERLFDTCIRHRHTAPSPGVMVWGAIGFDTRTRLVRIAGTLNSHRYISDVLEPVVLPYLQDLPAATFQQDNARPHVARTVQQFFTAQEVCLLPWPACSPDMSPIGHVWSLIGNRVARQTPPRLRLMNCGTVWKQPGPTYPKPTSEASFVRCRGV